MRQGAPAGSASHSPGLQYPGSNASWCASNCYLFGRECGHLNVACCQPYPVYRASRDVLSGAASTGIYPVARYEYPGSSGRRWVPFENREHRRARSAGIVAGSMIGEMPDTVDSAFERAPLDLSVICSSIVRRSSLVANGVDSRAYVANRARSFRQLTNDRPSDMRMPYNDLLMQTRR
jgi:hypothetical protein